MSDQNNKQDGKGGFPLARYVGWAIACVALALAGLRFIAPWLEPPKVSVSVVRDYYRTKDACAREWGGGNGLCAGPETIQQSSYYTLRNIFLGPSYFWDRFRKETVIYMSDGTEIARKDMKETRALAEGTLDTGVQVQIYGYGRQVGAGRLLLSRVFGNSGRVVSVTGFGNTGRQIAQ